MNKLEQILELLLAEETERAEELLHEYVVDKARSEYERVLDESEEDVEEEVEEAIDQTNDFEDDILQDEEELEADELGEDEDEDEMEMDMEEPEGDEMEMDMEEPEAEDDLEDKVEDLEAELEDLRAEFEKLMADEMDEPHHDDMEMDDDEEMMDSVEYDLDEAEEVDEEEELEEATQFSQNTSEQPMKGGSLKGSEADSNESPYSKAPKPTMVKNGNTGPVKSKDGSDGKSAKHSPKDHTPTNNLKVDPAKAKRPADGNYQ